MYVLEGYKNRDLVYGFSEVSDGNMSFIYSSADEVIENRKKLLSSLKIYPERTVTTYVGQKFDIVPVSPRDTGNLFEPGEIIKADTLVTHHKNLALFLVVADCIPIIITNKEKTILSIAHVGIANTKTKYIQRVIKNISTESNSSPNQLEVIIGPSLQKEHFIYEYFEDKDSEVWRGLVEKTEDGKFMIDNVGAVIKQLTDSGVKKENIYDCKIDTYTDERFFSHKKDFDNGKKDKGRFAAIAMLK
ncbi:MAG: polyphenol oxidase family protein [bacterium]